MSAELRMRDTRAMMEEPGLTRHVTRLDGRLASGLTATYPGVDAERIARYVARGRELRARWWLSRLRRLGGWLGRGRAGARRSVDDRPVCCGG